MGIAPAGEGAVVEGWEPNRKRVKEQEFLEDSQISSIDFLHTGGSVSTGLGLSLDDRRVGVSSGESSLVLSSIDEEIGREIQRQDAEMDRFLKLQVRGFFFWVSYILKSIFKLFFFLLFMSYMFF